MTPNDQELMRLRVDALFTFDVRGRMLRTNEQNSRIAPRLFVGRVPGGVVIRFGDNVPDDLTRDLADIVRNAQPLHDQRALAAIAPAIASLLARQAPVIGTGGGPVYRFPIVASRSVETVLITEANLALTNATFPWLRDELASVQPCVGHVQDGVVVSLCFCARRTDLAAEAGVETVPAFRGRGYATTVTAAWSDAVRATGRLPLYSTAWDNHASQGVARRLGLIRFGDDATWS